MSVTDKWRSYARNEGSRKAFRRKKKSNRLTKTDSSALSRSTPSDRIRPPMSVNDVHLMNDAVSSVIRVVNELEDTKRKLSLCQHELAQERLVRKRLERILFSEKSISAKTCDLHARTHFDKGPQTQCDTEPHKLPEIHAVNSSGYSTFDSRGERTRPSSRQVNKKYSETI